MCYKPAAPGRAAPVYVQLKGGLPVRIFRGPVVEARVGEGAQKFMKRGIVGGQACDGCVERRLELAGRADGEAVVQLALLLARGYTSCSCLKQQQPSQSELGSGSHLIKYPYSFYALARDVRDEDLKKRLLDKLYHLTAIT